MLITTTYSASAGKVRAKIATLSCRAVTSYRPELSTYKNHEEVARLLIRKSGLYGKWVGTAFGNRGFVFVRVFQAGTGFSNELFEVAEEAAVRVG